MIRAYICNIASHGKCIFVHNSRGYPLVRCMAFEKISKKFKKIVKMDQYIIYLFTNMQVKIRLIQFETKNNKFDRESHVLFIVKFVIIFYLYKLNLNIHVCEVTYHILIYHTKFFQFFMNFK